MAVGTQQPSRRPEAECGGLLAFLWGKGRDVHGRSLEDILEWDFEQMERVHNYIQWIFPTDEFSHYNASAPLLTPELQQIVSEEPDLKAALGRSFRRFCAFLGLEVVEAEGSPVSAVDDAEGSPSMVVRKGENFDERAEVCWCKRGRRNHNWLRISRVLHCLRLAGMDEEAAAFFACLVSLYEEGVPCGVALLHWRERAATVPAWRRGLGSDDQAEAPEEQLAIETPEKAVVVEAQRPFPVCFDGVWWLVFGLLRVK